MADAVVNVTRRRISVCANTPKLTVRAALGGVKTVYPPDYEGEYSVTPADEDIILPTGGRYLHGDITIEKIPGASKAIRKLCVLDRWEYDALIERSNDTLYYVRG